MCCYTNDYNKMYPIALAKEKLLVNVIGCADAIGSGQQLHVDMVIYCFYQTW